jgi:hypothetical protein
MNTLADGQAMVESRTQPTIVPVESGAAVA